LNAGHWAGPEKAIKKTRKDNPLRVFNQDVFLIYKNNQRNSVIV